MRTLLRPPALDAKKAQLCRMSFLAIALEGESSIKLIAQAEFVGNGFAALSLNSAKGKPISILPRFLEVANLLVLYHELAGLRGL